MLLWKGEFLPSILLKQVGILCAFVFSSKRMAAIIWGEYFSGFPNCNTKLEIGMRFLRSEIFRCMLSVPLATVPIFNVIAALLKSLGFQQNKTNHFSIRRCYISQWKSSDFKHKYFLAFTDLPWNSSKPFVFLNNVVQKYSICSQEHVSIRLRNVYLVRNGALVRILLRDE